MKFILASILCTLSIASASAAKRVSGYTKSNGTYVQSHMRTEHNHSKLDNYSTKGNVNPYTGKHGTVKPY